VLQGATESILTTEQTPNPTAPQGSASTPDPVARIEAWLNQGDDSTGQAAEAAQADESDKSTDSAATPDSHEGDAPDETKQPQVTTAQFAQMLGLDESALDVDESGAPVFRTKIDGKDTDRHFNHMRPSIAP